MKTHKTQAELTPEQLRETENTGHYYDASKKRFICGACGKWSRDELTIVKHQGKQAGIAK
jgi:hypothetical protein